MQPRQALQKLDISTQPEAKFTRQDYIAIQQALEVLDSLIRAMEAIEASKSIPKPKEEKP